MIQPLRRTDAIHQFATSLVSQALTNALTNFSHGISSTSTPRTVLLENPIQPGIASSRFSQAIVKTLEQEPEPDLEEETREYLYELYAPNPYCEKNEPTKVLSLKDQLKARLIDGIRAERQDEQEFNQELLNPTWGDIEDLYARCSQERLSLLQTPPSEERDCRIKQLEEKEKVLNLTLHTENIGFLQKTKLIFSKEHFQIQLEDKKKQKTLLELLLVLWKSLS